jgi:stage V sporulation protein AF
MLGSTFGGEVMIVDARTYPARDTAEPEGDLVMRGARDGFVETMIFNTALIRRRIRHPALTMQYLAVGDVSRTDVCICYMKDRADLEYVEQLKKRIKSIRVDALPMGQESLMECLIRRRWYNPFPKIRTTERPDTAAAQLLEGSVLIVCDNSPQVMVLPTSIFDFLQETNDYYFPPLTGTYIRITRQIIFWLALFFTPFWYLMIKNPGIVPGFLSFMRPEATGKIPIIAQLLLVEFLIDGLRMASLNTPNMLSNSLSVVGGLILGDFAVSIGWLIPEVILYMAFVAIANFTQRSYELGYAVKFLRILLLILTALFDVWGFVAGTILIVFLLASNRGINGRRSYLYPLIPFDGRALLSLLTRVKKPLKKHMGSSK